MIYLPVLSFVLLSFDKILKVIYCLEFIASHSRFYTRVANTLVGKMFGNIIPFLFLALTCVFAEKFRFDNYTLYKIYPKNLDQISLLRNLQMDTRFDFWTDPTPSTKFVNIMSAPESKIELETFFSDNDFTVEVTMPNIQE